MTKIHQTLTGARRYATSVGASHIIEVVTAAEGATGYIAAQAGKERIETVIRQTGKRLPGITRLVRDHPLHAEPFAAPPDVRLSVLMDDWQARRDRMDFTGAAGLEPEIAALRDELGYTPWMRGK